MPAARAVHPDGACRGGWFALPSRKHGPVARSAAVLDFHPGGPDGPENGYDRVHGMFRIPLAHFVEDG